MKLFAQIGHALGDKVDIGLNEGLIDGVIFSPKDMQKSTMHSQISELKKKYSSADILIDPQFYLSLYADSPQINLGKIEDWKNFKPYRKSDLELSDSIDKVLCSYCDEIEEMGVTGIITPGIYISQSFDSREAVIAKNFIRRTRKNYQGKMPLLSSLIICREALLDQKEFEEFLNDITLLDDPPDGFYLIIGGHSDDTRRDIYNADIIANWMMLNFSLSVNGFKVINGYSDILTPFLGVSGGYAGATGWWSNLRMFSINRFFPLGGGRQPNIRYLSKKLLNRIFIHERDQFSKYFPDIINRLPYDRDYNSDTKQNQQMFQSWEAIKSLNTEIISFDSCVTAVKNAQSAYAAWGKTGLPLDSKSDARHLEPLIEGFKLFKKRVQI